MTISQLYSALDAKYLRSTAMPGDVDGLQVCFDYNAPVRRVLLTLDITLGAANFAVANNFDTIVAHHALIYSPIAELRPDCPTAARVIALSAGRVNTISLHTRLDTAADGVNAILAQILQLTDTEPFYHNGFAAGLVGFLPKPMTAEEFAQFGGEQLKTRVTYTLTDKLIQRIAICGGGGSHYLPSVPSLGVDAYFTGELKHADIVAYAPLGLPLFIAGHHETEFPVMKSLAATIAQLDDGIYTEIYDSGLVVY